MGFDITLSRGGLSGFFNPFMSVAEPRPSGDDQQTHRVSHAARRLREVGRSLEMLNDAITEGATLENLNFAVETLREGLGRLDGRTTEETARQAEATGANEREEEEDVVMGRLEFLVRRLGIVIDSHPHEHDYQADQMLASINALRSGGESSTTTREEGTGTPPPPLEPIVRPTRRGSAGSDMSMPMLQSVSDTDESDPEDDESDDEYVSEGSDDDLNFEAVRGLVGAWSSANLDPDDELRNAEPGYRWSLTGSVPRPSARFSNVVERDNDDDLPALEPIEEAPPPQPETLAEPVVRPDDESKSGPRASDAFTTDGRGRVISIGGAESSEGTGEELAATATSEESPNTGSGGGGRSILGWINALF